MPPRRITMRSSNCFTTWDQKPWLSSPRWVTCFTQATELWEDIIIFIILYRIISIISYHHIISYHIISYHIILYHIISSRIVSYYIVSYHFVSYHISYHISYRIISYRILSYRVVLYRIILIHITEYSPQGTMGMGLTLSVYLPSPSNLFEIDVSYHIILTTFPHFFMYPLGGLERFPARCCWRKCPCCEKTGWTGFWEMFTK